MKKIKLIIWGLCVAFFFASCSEFLKEDSQDEVRVQSVKDFKELVRFYMPYDQSTFEFCYALDDDIRIDFNKLYSSANATAEKWFGVYTWQYDMWEKSKTLQNVYKEFYGLIMGMNAVLDGIDDAVGSQEGRDRVKAEALGLRGFYYLTLVNLFGQPYNYNKEALGVPLKVEAAIEENPMPRNTVAEVYARIVEDLETSSSLFAKYPKQRGDYHINGTIVDVWLSRTYLYMEEWEKAAEAAGRAIASAEGLTDYTAFDQRTPFYMSDYAKSEVEWIYGRAFVKREIKPSFELLACYGAQDCRKNLWLNRSGEIVKLKAENNNLVSIAARISEAYLTRAEALILQSAPDLEGALKDLQILRRHRIIGYVNEDIADAEELLAQVRLERRRELSFEGGLRWFDLRRYGMPSITHDFKLKKTDDAMRYTLMEKDPCYTLPIPATALENNGLLEQNPSGLAEERVGVIVND